MTCLLLSRSFHEDEGLKEVIVPLPSWIGRSPFAESQAEKDQVEQKYIERNELYKQI